MVALNELTAAFTEAMDDETFQAVHEELERAILGGTQ